MRSRLTRVIAIVVVLGLAAAAWFWRGSAPVASAAHAIGIQTESTTPDTAATLQAAGVHKCVGARGTAYIDGPCPAGSHEVEAHGGTVTVMSFPKAAPEPSAPASGVLGSPLAKPMNNEERDRLRERQVDAAAQRP